MDEVKIKHRNPATLAVIKRAMAGMSFTEIAEDLGITRNTISGIIYRARHKGMIFPTTRSEPKQDRPAPAPRPKDAAPPKPRIVPIRPAKTVLVVDANYRPRRVTIMEVRDGLCRWPLWGNDAPHSERFYCGNESAAGQVYCQHCRALSSRPATNVLVVKKVFSMKRRMAA